MIASLNIFPTLLSLFLISVSAQSPNNTAQTDFTCSKNSPSTCETYVTYRVRPPFSDLSAISNLFKLSTAAIAAANNLTSLPPPPLFPDQLLIIPINCTSNGTHYASNVTYKMNKDDSFYTVSTAGFQNLTNFRAVEETNPLLDPTNLTVGVEVVFPLLCKCAPENEHRIRYLITYVWQTDDDLSSVCSTFGASKEEMVTVNNNRNFSNARCLPVLVPVNAPVVLQTLASRAYSSSNTSHQFTLVVVLSIVTAFLILCLLLYKKNRISTFKASSKEINFQDKLLLGVSGYLCNPIVYDLDVVMKATSSLNERRRIGRSVYRGVIDGREVAVKKTSVADDELRILQRVNHSNLVKLIGVSSSDDGGLFVVYEYAANGSLDAWLFGKLPPEVTPLSWNQRLFIALDVANGLQYLHEHARPSIVHRDISTRNILLDSNFKAKISNFSAAKPTPCSILLNVDVFCLGIVVLELLSGRKAIETNENGDVMMLWVEINEILEGGEGRKERLRNWMDFRLRKCCFSIDDALSLAAIARACVSEKASERPTMGEVVLSLSVIVQSSPKMYGRPWISEFEGGGVCPVKPR